MTSAGGLAVDAVLGDEIRAGQTIWDALRGKPVSASAATDAAITIGSDLLMAVPGLGAAAAAFKAGRAARAATKGAKAVKQLKQVKADANILHKIDKSKATLGQGLTGNQFLKLQKLEKKSAALNNTISKSAKKLGMTVNPTEARFAKAARQAVEKKAAMKKKRNTPRRKKMRYTGHVISDTANIQQLARMYDQEDES